jgi:hypothetical protein
MKKMIVMASVLLMAVFSQAATISWGASGAAYFNTTKITAAAGNMGYGYLCAFEGNGGVLNAAVISALYTEWKGGAGTTADIMGPQASTSLGYIQNTIIVANGGALGSTGLVLTDKVTYFANVFFATRSGQDYVYQSGSTLYDTTGPNWSSPSTTLTAKTAMPSGTTWTTIPEPTSMALLALGVAAFGLRRKMKK